MLRRLKLSNFKCFEELDLELSNLNVLAGINSMGKSSVVQALLLLRQSYDMGAITKGIHLNGEAVRIGTGFDLLYRNSSQDRVGIEIDSDDASYHCDYQYEKESDFQKIHSDYTTWKTFQSINLFFSTFSYVSAERIGPKSFYEKSYHQIYEKNQVGYRGELFADYIAERGFTDRIENRRVLHPGTDSSFLIYQLEAWMSEISPGVHINPKKYMDAGIVGIGYNVSEYEFTPLNVGFGISYAAPVIISLLKAKSGDLVILENPEAHLHPKGQRIMGELIAKACSGGVQVIVETHSDHLLNGIRLSVKNRVIDRNLVRLNYFYQTEEAMMPRHRKSSPAILEDGSLSDWPEGFFDEWDKTIDALF
ncbi:putative ATPase [Anaerotaenia torta]|uniref:AAA family ATPase n=1 Tax=Anaerotaenia torta TaxID=433293 RepID=UPI003D24F6C8